MNFGIRFARSKSNMGTFNGNDSVDLLSKADNKTICSLLSGEIVLCKEATSEGSIVISNYRVTLQYNDAVFYIPLYVIEQVETRKISFLHILCKDAKSYKCTFSTVELCLEWQKKIEEEINCSLEINKTFAAIYYENMAIENPELHSMLTSHLNGMNYATRANKLFQDEVKRLGYDIQGPWRICTANEDYRLCASYPKKIIVPSFISDSTLEEVARFRSSRRIPAVVWRHPNGAIIARSSQPEVGWLGWRRSQDEELLRAFAEACAYNCPNKDEDSSIDRLAQEIDNSVEWSDNLEGNRSYSGSSDDTPSIIDLSESTKHKRDFKKLLIVDARSYATAVANRARGGGCECPEYYPRCEIQFMNLDNIHCIRKSHHAVRHLVSMPPDIPNWLSLLENSRWLSHLAGLLSASVTIARTVSIEARPVLVHCSDGWDRTPQLTALSQLLMDPFYRTIEGFEVLVEREWVEFGHKFSDRCGCGIGTEDCNERSPIFLQWLDCVHQLLLQFPVAFQFNQAFLVKLSQHVYSNLFGNFLFNTSMKRDRAELKAKFYSVWSYFKLSSHQYVNLLFNPTNQVLKPDCDAKDMGLWKAVYVNKAKKAFSEYDSENQDIFLDEDEESILQPKKELVKTKSCDNIANLDCEPSPAKGRRSSDPNIRDGLPDLAMLKSALGTEILDDNLELQCEESNGDTNSHDKTNGFCDIIDESIIIKQQPNNRFDVSVASKECNFKNIDEEIEGFRHKSNLELGRRLIEGSTDTLVSESGILSAQQETPALAVGELECSIKRKLSPREKDSIDSINTSLKASSQKLGLISISDENNAHHEENKNCSSISECSFCFQNRKMSSEVKCALDNHISSVLSLQRQNSKGAKNGSSPGHSRSSSLWGNTSTPSNERISYEKPLNSAFDGLSNYSDEITRRLGQIKYQYQMETENLRKELHATKTFYIQRLQNKLSNHHSHENHSEDQVSLPESVSSGSGGSVSHESGGSENSWENVEGEECKSTLWVPDHAVDRCMGCQARFWTGNRKHHCSCGKIFCSGCSDHCSPIPKENLHEPVRVCGNCFSNLIDIRARPIPVASN